MYIIDKLMLLNHNEHADIDQELAIYFLNNIHNIQYKTLNDIIKETAVSKASIHRFFKKSGFVSYRDFLDELSQEYAIVLEQKKNHKKITLQDYQHYLEMFQFQNNYSILAKKITQAKRLIMFGNIEYIRMFQGISYYCLNHHIEIKMLLAWNQEENIKILQSMNENDVFLMIDVDHTLLTMWENVMDRSYLLDLNIVLSKKCFKGFIGQVKQEHHHFIQLHVPYHQDINLKKCGLLFLENQLINLIEKEKK